MARVVFESGFYVVYSLSVHMYIVNLVPRVVHIMNRFALATCTINTVR